MIPEYKFYHGVVLAELVQLSPRAVAIDELHEQGRLTSYKIDGRLGLHIKHSTQRLHPWSFTFSAQNVRELRELRTEFSKVFVVLVCCSDGMVCLQLDDFLAVLSVGEANQAWIKIDRTRGKWYDVGSERAGQSRKFPSGLDPLLEALVEDKSSLLREG